MFSDSLVGLTGLRKKLLYSVTDYYSKRIHINISKGKRHIRQRLGKKQDKLPVVLT